MDIQVPFIGREEILKEIYTVIEQQETQQVICIQALGGIGKTRLLEEIAKKYQAINEQQKTLFATDIIDFDDQSFMSPKQTGRRIAWMLGEDSFSSYFAAQQEYHQMMNAGVSLDDLEQVRQDIRIKFAECFNKTSKNTRVVLFFDTTDHLEESKGMWGEFKTIAYLRNICVVLTGRNAHHVGHWLKNQDIAHVHTIDLSPLNEKESEIYLDSKRRSRLIRISDERREKLIKLSDGRPILLDLAVEWLSRDISMEWLDRIDISKLGDQKNKKEFEKKLLRKISALREFIDRLVLIMANVYPLNEEMIAHFIDTDAQALMAEAKTYVFIKQLPDGYITLHDEVRRMVNEYIFPKNRQDIFRQLKEYSKYAAEYYAKKIKELSKVLSEMPNSDTEAGARYMKKDDILSQRHRFMEQQVRHTFFWDTERGIKVYSDVIWKLRSHYRISAVIRLQESVKQYLPEFTDGQKRKYELSRARLLNDSGKAEEAEAVLNELLQGVVDRDERANIFNALAVSEVSLGKLKQALGHQEECFKIFTQTERIEFIPDIANHTGCINEQIGNIKKAVEYYHKALEAAFSIPTPSRNLMAKTFDNLSRAYCQQGLFTEAQSYIDQAIKIWDIIKAENQIPRGEITQGMIYRGLGRYDDAEKYLRRAIKRLREPDGHRKLVKAFFHLGWTQWFKADAMEGDERKKMYIKTLKSARHDFEHSLQLAENYRLTADIPGILHQMSNVYHLLGEKEKAVQANNRAYDLSRKVHDIRYAVDSLVGKAEFDYADGRYDRIPDYARELKKEFENEGYEFSRSYGRMRRIMADIAFEGQEGKYRNIAWKNYIKETAQIRLHSGYGMYSISREFLRLEKRLNTLPTDIAITVAIRIKREWTQLEPAEKYILMLSWCDQQIVNLQLKALDEVDRINEAV